MFTWCKQLPVAPAPRAKTRLYLAAPERRKHLLDIAAESLCADGWASLSMQGVAEAAGVSRQLVYQHFASLDDLHSALLIHLFETPYQATRGIARSGEEPQPILRRAFEQFLEMPERQRRLLRALASEDHPDRSELAALKKHLRGRIADLWVPYVTRVTALPEAEARSLAWMLVMAAWGLSDLIRDREIESAAAVDLFVQTAEGAIAASRARSATQHG